MGLTPGARLGPYEIVSLLGSGGMGEVYKGRDPRLGRDVAIKVLPRAFSADPDRLTRFEQEARAAAALSHPNILAVYDVGDERGSPYIVSELLDGETLRDRLAAGPLPVRKAVEYAVHIAHGLSAAHERGIVHRDLKPENVFMTSDGRVKILDFGLAKLTQAEPAVSIASALPTTPPQTNPGVVLGTVGYMSPEQVRGLAADHRSDIFAFGVILYEMLSGHRAFRGETAMDTMTAILKEDPTDLPIAERHIPPPLERIVDRCIQKSPASRFKSADDLAFALEALSSHSDPRVTTASSSPLRWPRFIAVAAALAATAAIASYMAWTTKPDAPPSPVARSTIALPAGDSFSNFGVRGLAISPDGRHLVYSANFRLYLRSMDRLDASPIRGTESATNDLAAPGRQPFFSPDGRWIGFWQDGQLKKVSIDGGTPVALCAAENPWGASWMTDNTILYSQSEQGGGAGVWRVSANGGKPEQVVKLEPGQLAQGPQMLPGGRAILFALAGREDPTAAQIVVHSLDTGRRHVVIERGSDARYLATGHVVYALRGTLFAVPFDVTTLAVGTAVPLVDEIARQNVTAQFAIADQGALVYVPRDAVDELPQARGTLAWVDRQGREFPIKAAPPHAYLYPRLSPEGTRVALEIREPPNSAIHIWDFARENLMRLTLGETFSQYAVWTPDGHVIFGSSRFGTGVAPRSLMRIASDGTGAVEQLAPATVAQFPSSVTPDGRDLIFRAATSPLRPGGVPGTDVFLLPLQGDRRPRPLLHEPYNELNAEVSRDGRWLAYQSNESGQDEVYVRPFPNVDAGRKTKASSTGGRQPLWSRNGDELFYVSNGVLMRVPVKLAPTFAAGIPAPLFKAAAYQLTPRGGGLGRMYDVSRDGQRFLMIKEGGTNNEAPPAARIILVQNWLNELKARVPAK